MAELVRVKDKFQVTIPLQVRSAVAIRTGDYLEASVVPEGILLRPRRVIAPPQPVRTLLQFLKASHGAARTKAEIDAALDAQRDQW